MWVRFFLPLWAAETAFSLTSKPAFLSVLVNALSLRADQTARMPPPLRADWISRRPLIL